MNLKSIYTVPYHNRARRSSELKSRAGLQMQISKFTNAEQWIFFFSGRGGTVSCLCEIIVSIQRKGPLCFHCPFNRSLSVHGPLPAWTHHLGVEGECVDIRTPPG